MVQNGWARLADKMRVVGEVWWVSRLLWWVKHGHDSCELGGGQVAIKAGALLASRNGRLHTPPSHRVSMLSLSPASWSCTPLVSFCKRGRLNSHRAVVLLYCRSHTSLLWFEGTTTADRTTAAATTAAPASTTTGPVCKNWCGVNRKTWATKCKLRSMCDGCSQCSGPCWYLPYTSCAKFLLVRVNTGSQWKWFSVQALYLGLRMSWL